MIERVIIEDNELLPIIVREEAKDIPTDKSRGIVRNPLRNPVQLRMEKEIAKHFIITQPGSYGFAIDAINYISMGHGFEWAYHNFNLKTKQKHKEADVLPIRRDIITLSGKIEDAFLKAVTDYNINQKGAEEILQAIFTRYDKFSKYGERRIWHPLSQEILNKSKHPNEVLWTPWFKQLEEDYRKTIEGIKK